METPRSSQLPRVLGPWMATAIVIGTVIGSGVFKKPHAVAKDLTEFGLIMLAWILVGALSFIGSLILAEIAIIHPKAGGNYVFLREGYGRWAGFLWGWVEFWIIRTGSIAALASVFAEAFHDILRYAFNDPGNRDDVLKFWAQQGVTVTVIAVLAFVNARGTVLGGGLQVVVTTVKVGSLLAIALAPFVFLAFSTESKVSVDNLAPIWPTEETTFTWSKFGGALIGIFWAYHGWMNLAPVAEEVKEPNRNLPLAFLLGTLAVIVLYCSVNVAYHLVVTRTEMVMLGGSSPVATIFTENLFGSVGLLLASLALMTSVFGSLNGNLLVGPRLLYAMGQDGLAPHPLCQIHRIWGTPARAIGLMAGWAVLLVVGGGLLRHFKDAINGQLHNLGEAISWTELSQHFQVTDKALFDVLTDYAMFGALSFETLAVASIFMCRRQYPVGTVQLPYRCWGYPWLPIIYVLVVGAVLLNMFQSQPTESLIAVSFIAFGALVYLLIFAGRAPKAGG